MNDSILKLITISEKDREKPDINYIEVGNLLKKLREDMTLKDISEKLKKLGVRWDESKICRVIKCAESGVDSINALRYKKKAEELGVSITQYKHTKKKKGFNLTNWINEGMKNLPEVKNIAHYQKTNLKRLVLEIHRVSPIRTS